MGSIFELGNNIQNLTYNSPTPGQITLMAGKPNNGTSGLDATLCTQLKDCGFNAAAAVIGNK